MSWLDKATLNRILKKYKKEMDSCIEEEKCLAVKSKALGEIVDTLEKKLAELEEKKDT